MKASICMATGNRPQLLRKTLESIYRQQVPFEFETIIVDNGVETSDRECAEFPVTWIRSDPTHGRSTPAVARNIAYRHATGEVIIAQSDEVIHGTADCIERLVRALEPGTFVIATVSNVDASFNHLRYYTSADNKRPLFFLGSLWRSDLYAVGGNDEEFGLCCEDMWFARCLMEGLHLGPTFARDIVGYHQDHPATGNSDDTARCKRLYFRKKHAAQRSGTWEAKGGRWQIVEG